MFTAPYGLLKTLMEMELHAARMAERRPSTFRTALGDEVTTIREIDSTGRLLVESIQIETPLSLVRDPKATPDTGRNWEIH